MFDLLLRYLITCLLILQALDEILFSPQYGGITPSPFSP